MHGKGPVYLKVYLYSHFSTLPVIYQCAHAISDAGEALIN